MLRGERHGVRRALAGFATPAAMALSAVIGLISAGAMHEALFGEQLASTRMLHQRALALAELGIEAGLGRLEAMQTVQALNFSIQPLAGATDMIRITIRPVASAPMPEGASAARLGLHHFEITSTGHAARGSRAVLVLGASRLFPAEAVAGGGEA